MDIPGTIPGLGVTRGDCTSFVLLWSVVVVLQEVSAQLMAEDFYVGKVIGMEDLSPAVGPFESADDRSYKDRRFMKAVNRKARERLEEKKQQERKNTATGNVRRKNRKGTTQEKNENQSNSIQGKRMDAGTMASEMLEAMDEITGIATEVKRLKALSGVLRKLSAQVHKMELSVEPLEKLSSILEGASDSKQTQEGNSFRGINNVNFNNEYHIGNIFTINRSEPKCKAAERPTGSGLEKVVENFQGSPFETNEPLLSLEKNLSRAYSQQKVSMEQIKEISRIIDFVERYHGIMEGMKKLEGKGGREGVYRDEGSVRGSRRRKGNVSLKRRSILT